MLSPSVHHLIFLSVLHKKSSRLCNFLCLQSSYFGVWLFIDYLTTVFCFLILHGIHMKPLYPPVCFTEFASLLQSDAVSIKQTEKRVFLIWINRKKFNIPQQPVCKNISVLKQRNYQRLLMNETVSVDNTTSGARSKVKHEDSSIRG